MYDLYPDWGPAKHRTDEPAMDPTSNAALQAAVDLRDAGTQRPDDN